MRRTQRLSKSRFTAGLQCLKQLWWRVHEPQAPELVVDPQTQAIFDQGAKVGAVARTHVPGGRLVDRPYNAYAERLALTRQFLDERVPAIYEACFVADDVFVAVDILERSRDGFHLIEVKSSTSVKDEHLPDAAIQLHVLGRSGLDVGRAEVMHLNRACAYPDLHDLFVRQDVTAEAEALLPGIPGSVRTQLEALAGPLPEVAIGDHCSAPRACPFIERCWPTPPAHHVSTLYFMRQRAAALEAEGYSTIFQLPPDVSLNRTAARQVRAVRSGRMVVEPGLAEALETFEPPLAYLDFETVNPAIPVWDGCHPYDAIPAQFSCHVENGTGGFDHHEWIAEGSGDPRRPMAERVIAACRGARTIVAYNASFESGCLQRVAAALPDLREELARVQARLADPLPVVRNFIYHPDFGGSFSLKSVLPALVPELEYDELEVAEGNAASVHLARLMFEPQSLDAAERTRLLRALHRYCELDTWGMVKLLERLRGIAARS